MRETMTALAVAAAFTAPAQAQLHVPIEISPDQTAYVLADSRSWASWVFPHYTNFCPDVAPCLDPGYPSLDTITIITPREYGTFDASEVRVIHGPPNIGFPEFSPDLTHPVVLDGVTLPPFTVTTTYHEESWMASIVRPYGAVWMGDTITPDGRTIMHYALFGGGGYVTHDDPLWSESMVEYVGWDHLGAFINPPPVSVTSVPEPETWVLLLAGLAVVTTRARRALRGRT